MKNNKKISVIFILIGIILILFGITLFDKEKKEISKEEKIMVDTNEIVGIKIENEKYPYYENLEFEYSYVKDLNLNRKNKYVFPYPKTAKSTYHSEFYRIFKNDDMIITAEINWNLEINDYIEKIKEEYSTYSYGIFNYSKINEIKTSEYTAKYFKIQAYSDLEKIEGKFGNNNYIENFIIMIEVEESTIVFSYISLSKKMSDEFLSQVINKIEINKNMANYLSTTNKDGYLSGNLEIMDIYQNSKIYKMNYKINAEKFYEVEDFRNDYNQIMLYTKDDSIFTSMSLMQSNLNDIDSVINEYLKNYYMLYELTNYKEEELSINNHNYKVLSFNPIADFQKEVAYYKQFFEKIDDNLYVIISCSSEQEINTEEIIKYFDYNIQEE